LAKDILKLIEEKEAESERTHRRGVIISPGAIGDCVLMLPLAVFMKESLQLGGVDFFGHTDYIGYFPGRTCIDGIRSIDSIEFHRLFADSKEFSIEDGDSLVNSFMRYEWIVSFLGHDHSDFEDNLIFTVHCSHSAEIATLPLVAEGQINEHISKFYIDEFIKANFLEPEPFEFDNCDILVKAHTSDIVCGGKLLEGVGLKPLEKIVAIHPGSGGDEKCWYIDNFCMVAEALSEKDIQIVFLLGPKEQERLDDKIIQKLQGLGMCLSGLDLTEIVQIITCSDLFLGNDSGITHLAGVMGTRTLAVFGPTNPNMYKPLGPRVRVYSANSDSFRARSVESGCEVINIVFEMLED
jgi:heptosyltransferase-3